MEMEAGAGATTRRPVDDRPCGSPAPGSLSWSAQWGVVIAGALMVPAYASQWLIFGAVTAAPALWITGLVAGVFVQASVEWSLAERKRRRGGDTRGEVQSNRPT